jgi:hypothetical protein
MEVVRKAWREGEQRTAAVAAVDAIAGVGFVVEEIWCGGVGLLLLRALQVLLEQVVHFFGLLWIGDWVVDEGMCRR